MYLLTDCKETKGQGGWEGKMGRNISPPFPHRGAMNMYSNLQKSFACILKTKSRQLQLKRLRPGVHWGSIPNYVLLHRSTGQTGEPGRPS